MQTSSTTSTVTAQRQIKLAHIKAWGEAPVYFETDAPDYPKPESNRVQLQVSGSAVHTLVRLRGSGRHYSATKLPHIPGIDGVGTDSSGKDVYFFDFGGTAGSFAEVVNVPKQNVIPLPPGADKMQIAALVNPAMSSWMALRRRAVILPPRFSVLVMGVNSLSGRLAVSMARALGAAEVIGCARDESKMRQLDLDRSIVLDEGSAAQTDFSHVGHVDIILDYLYAEPAVTLLQSLKPKSTMVQYINIGDLAGRDMVLPSSTMRSRKLIMMASGVGSWSIEELKEELPALMEAMISVPKQDLKILPLSQVEEHWNDHSHEKIIYVP